ncbi:hypothetical protein [Arenibacter certesii]|uniref:Uncharacterized protein n=1 Tax=Arenibacter certesii TaxID=228955 RepID=A0A918MPC5_9FLAO|nr:hypothetical protein [Arenibacter certesii]GGW46219.1 hypothetical protein GCM10007383_33160 [Arenibacter certesii]
MDPEILNWKNLWKEEKSGPLDITKLIADLNKIEKRGRTERIALLIALPMTLILLLFLLPVLSNTYYLTAVSLIGLGMIMILIQIYKSRFGAIKNEAELSNQKYIVKLIDKLKKQMLITSRYMWFYTLLLILGINIGYVAILEHSGLSLFSRIMIHSVLSAAMFAFMYFSILKRKKKNNQRILPLIAFLDNLKRS